MNSRDPMPDALHAPAPAAPRGHAEHGTNENAHALDAGCDAASMDAGADAYGCVEWFDFDAHAARPPRRAEMRNS